MGLLPSWEPIMSTLDSFPLLQPLLHSALDTGFQLDQSLLILGLVLPFRSVMQWLPHAQKEDADNSAPSPVPDFLSKQDTGDTRVPPEEPWNHSNCPRPCPPLPILLILAISRPKRKHRPSLSLAWHCLWFGDIWTPLAKRGRTWDIQHTWVPHWS